MDLVLLGDQGTQALCWTDVQSQMCDQVGLMGLAGLVNLVNQPCQVGQLLQRWYVLSFLGLLSGQEIPEALGHLEDLLMMGGQGFQKGHVGLGRLHLL